MARMPGTEWIGSTPNETPNGMAEHRGLVLHIQEGTEAGSESWFKNPDAQASAHFLNPKTGGLRQLVDTDDKAWAEMGGNRYWVSVENEGMSGESLTHSQLENCAQLLAWLGTRYGVPFQSTDDPNGKGLGWHGMGGDAWGGHPDCPGEPIKAQRGAIIARAQQLAGQNTPTPTPTPQPWYPSWPGRYLRNQQPMMHGDDVRTWQNRMSARGWTIGVDGWFGSQSDQVCRAFQQDKGLQVDGVVGPNTWQAAWTSPVT